MKTYAKLFFLFCFGFISFFTTMTYADQFYNDTSIIARSERGSSSKFQRDSRRPDRRFDSGQDFSGRGGNYKSWNYNNYRSDSNDSYYRGGYYRGGNTGVYYQNPVYVSPYDDSATQLYYYNSSQQQY